jgi:hypothetical protein
MRKASRATVAVILAIALYFTVSLGFDGLRALTSPAYGLDEAWRSQFIFALGGLLGLSPAGLIKLAAFFAAVKLTAAVVCGLHLADRFRALAGGKANSEILEGGLILVVLVSILAGGPAVWSNNGAEVRDQAIHLVLAALAIALCMVERSFDTPAETEEPVEAVDGAAAEVALPKVPGWFSPWR